LKGGGRPITSAQRDGVSPETEALSPSAIAERHRKQKLSQSRFFKVLKIAPTSFFADYGCHVRIYEETAILQAMGNQVTICTYHTGSDLEGLDIRRAMNTPGRNSVRVGSNIHKIYYDLLLSIRTVETALRIRPHIVHAHLHEGALIGYPISRLLRVPLVFDFQGSLTSEMLDHHFIRRESCFYGPLLRLERLINRMPHAVITSSRNAAEVLAREFAYPKHKIFTIPDCVNAQRFLPRWQVSDTSQIDQLKARLGIPRDRKVVVYLGLLAEYQGTGKLLEAAAYLIQERKLPVHFLIMGFPGEDYYRRRAWELGLSGWVTFTGRIPYFEAPQYLLLGDIAVSPKISETEGNGKLLNYMAAGLPTVTFNTPVAREILGDMGVYAKLGDARSLAEGLEFLLVAERAASEIAVRLRMKALREHSWERVGQQISEIYTQLSR
jgi:glycosyltransferase involved in cell wall biosynthesis